MFEDEYLDNTYGKIDPWPPKLWDYDGGTICEHHSGLWELREAAGKTTKPDLKRSS